jgi:hypothetical protein
MHSRRRAAANRIKRPLSRYLEALERRLALTGAPSALPDAYQILQDETLLTRPSVPDTAEVEWLNEDFSDGASELWSSSLRSETPSGEDFLGRFGNDELRLSLVDLPRHGQVRLEFDLYVIQSWDGPGDEFRLSSENGASLIDRSFNNHGGAPDAVAIDTLGYAHQGDAIYHFSFTLDHKDAELAFVFAGQGLQHLDDESWGLDNVKVMLVGTEPAGPVGVLGNDAPADGGELTAELHSAPLHGEIVLDSSGAFAYVPDEGYSGTDRFFYVAREGDQVSAPTLVTIEVARATPPVAEPDEYFTPQGVTLRTQSTETVLLFDDFEQAPSTAWSSDLVARTPVGDRGFLGRFNNDSVSLQLDDLPAHSFVVVEFDLYLIASWDGSDGLYEFDRWSFGLAGETPLVDSTFSNHDPAGFQSPRQHYPDPFGGSLHPAGTGAVSSDTLGYLHQGDSIYHFRFAIPHVDDALELVFAASGLQHFDDENWGLDNVRVTLNTQGVLANDHDPEGATLQASLLQPPRFGTLAWNADGTFEYLPNPGFVGADSFTYRAFDGTSYSSATPITIQVLPIAPEALDDQFVVAVNGALSGQSVLSNDEPLNDRPVTAQLVDEPLNGELSLSPEGLFTYIPRPGFRGTDVFTYRLNDTIAQSQLARVTIDVSQPRIVVGSHSLAPNTAGQRVPILVDGPFDISSLNLFAQVGDGGPELSELGLPAGTRGPKITHVELASETIFGTGELTVIPQPGLPQVAIVSASSSVPVRAAGVLAVLTVDTTGLVEGTWELKLSDVLPGLPSGGLDTNFGAIAADFVAGSLTVGPARVVGRRLFYNNSSFDGYDPAANLADIAAIAPDKTAMFPGQAAGPAQVSSYVHGINGVAIDIKGALRAPLAQDFVFRVSQRETAGNWAIAPTPNNVVVLPGQGEGGSDRVLLTWPDGAIKNQWLQVTLRASPSLGLVSDDIFVFGNLVGDTLQHGFGQIDNTDLAYVSANPHGPLNPAELTDHADFDRDGLVNATDLAIAQLNLNAQLLSPYSAIPPLAGDANGDGQVSLTDFAILKANFGKSGGAGDFNEDGIVDLNDFQLLKTNFGLKRPG